MTGSGGTAKKPTVPSGDAVFSKNRFQALAKCLAVLPVATAALGPVAGLPAARLVASHFSVMTQNSQVLIAGPAVVKRALGIDITKEELGGPDVHLKSGTVDNLAENEEDALNQIKTFLSYLPDNYQKLPPNIKTSDSKNRVENDLIDIIPKNKASAVQTSFLVRLIDFSSMDSGLSSFENTSSTVVNEMEPSSI